MTATREVIYAALFTQLQTAGSSFSTYSRRWLSVFDDSGQALKVCPMLCQHENYESITWLNRGIGRIMVLSIKVEIMAVIPADITGRAGHDRITPGSSILNPLLDAVTAALAPTGYDGKQTLGDVVDDCRIEGEIVKALGDEDPSGLCAAVIPISIFVPY